MSQEATICVNLYGHAYRHGLTNRKRYRKVTTLSVSSKPYGTYLNERKKGRREEHQASRQHVYDEDIEPLKTAECMIVGLVLGPHVDIEKIGRIASGCRKRRSIGTSVPRDVIETLPPSAEEPYFAVVPMTNIAPLGGIKLYVLMDTGESYPKPFNVSRHEVFYFDEFRDESTATEQRKSTWSKLISDKVIRSLAESNREPPQDLLMPSHPFHKFLNPSESFNRADAESVVVNMLKKWPDAGVEFSEDIILGVRKAYEAGSVSPTQGNIVDLILRCHYVLGVETMIMSRYGDDCTITEQRCRDAAVHAMDAIETHRKLGL